MAPIPRAARRAPRPVPAPKDNTRPAGAHARERGRGKASPRPGERRASRQARGAGSHPRTWWRGATPPGGWAVAGLVVLALMACAGLLLPESPIGRPLRALLGRWAVLGALWPAYLAWRLTRGGRVPVGQTTALGVLTATLLVLAQLLDSGTPGGGLLGRALLEALDGGFGRVAGLALLSLGGIAAVVMLVGSVRIGRGLVGLGLLARRLIGSHTRVAGDPSDRGTGRLQQPDLLASIEPRPASGELVILGPRGALPGSPTDAAPARASEARRTAERSSPAPDPVEVRAIEPGLVEWLRPDPRMLSTATDNGAFSPAELKARAKVIEETLASFSVQARVVEVQQGPAITQFGLDPSPGVAVSKIVSRQHDLALRLGAPSLRVLAPVPGRPLVGLEVPNTTVAMVTLGDLLAAPAFSKSRLPIGIGMDVSGKPVVGDLARMPHLLIAGATGSGKSVSINALIASLLVARTPDEAQLVLVDPKQVEMTQYKGLPHLRLPVVTDMDKVVATLRWTVLEMERRYNRFSEAGARNIVTFNEKFPEERLSYLVIVIDELADMMMTAADDVEKLICRLAQLGRAAGIHLVVATQRPSVDVLTGLIKANLPTRIAFAVSSQTDSRVIMDRAGAERLLGRGDALYQAGDEMNPRRVQGAFVSDEEIERLCNHWRAQGGTRHTDEDEAQLEKLARQEDPEEKLVQQAREIMEEKDGDVTVAYLQRKLKVGLQKADRIYQRIKADEAAAKASPYEDLPHNVEWTLPR